MLILTKHICINFPRSLIKITKSNCMKRFAFCLFFLSAVNSGFAQHGLENILVEKYYISDAKDAAAKLGGHLPVGSVTYRIFVDMLPAYRFQAAYGVPGHELRIATTTSFFNNEDAGATTANEIPKNKLQDNTVMLDSWLSVGAAAQNNAAIPKVSDTSDAILHVDGILQNADGKQILSFTEVFQKVTPE